MAAEKLKIYSPKDVHEMFGLSLNTVYAIFRQDTFPAIRIGRRFFVTEMALLDWMQRYEGKRYYV